MVVKRISLRFSAFNLTHLLIIGSTCPYILESCLSPCTLDCFKNIASLNIHISYTRSMLGALLPRFTGKPGLLIRKSLSGRCIFEIGVFGFVVAAPSIPFGGHFPSKRGHVHRKLRFNCCTEISRRSEFRRFIKRIGSCVSLYWLKHSVFLRNDILRNNSFASLISTICEDT